MKIPLISATILLGLMATPRAASASILYSTTDLGTGYQLQTNGSGQVYGVNGSLGVDYAFDKSPVTSINLRTDNLDGSIQFLTMQNGNHQAGYINNQVYSAGLILYPTLVGANSGWFIQSNVLFNGSPVSDINNQGQVVGISQYSVGQVRSYAAFSDPNGQNRRGLYWKCPGEPPRSPLPRRALPIQPDERNRRSASAYGDSIGG
jgi:hypothetical protein